MWHSGRLGPLTEANLSEIRNYSCYAQVAVLTGLGSGPGQLFSLNVGRQFGVAPT
jgi:hypothetical protein